MNTNLSRSNLSPSGCLEIKGKVPRRQVSLTFNSFISTFPTLCCSRFLAGSSATPSPVSRGQTLSAHSEVFSGLGFRKVDWDWVRWSRSCRRHRLQFAALPESRSPSTPSLFEHPAGSNSPPSKSASNPVTSPLLLLPWRPEQCKAYRCVEPPAQSKRGADWP